MDANIFQLIVWEGIPQKINVFSKGRFQRGGWLYDYRYNEERDCMVIEGLDRNGQVEERHFINKDGVCV